MVSNIGLGNGKVPLGDRPLPYTKITKFSSYICPNYETHEYKVYV